VPKFGTPTFVRQAGFTKKKRYASNAGGVSCANQRKRKSRHVVKEMRRMQTYTATQIVADIVAHIQKSGYPFGQWYAGIASSIDDRLFGDHRVPKENHWYAYRKAISDEHARQAEADLLRLGCRGGSGGGDEGSVFVYAYLITAITRE